jgi:hypothetical protein
VGPNGKAGSSLDLLREAASLDRAGGHIFNPPARITHQVVMVISVAVSQLISGGSFPQRHPADDVEGLE